MNRHSISTDFKSSLVSTILLWSAVAGPALGQTPVPATSPDGAKLAIELNSAESMSSDCRLTFTALNTTGTDLGSVVFETVLFGKDGAVTSLSLFDFQDLPNAKPRVRQFDLAGQSCDGIGQLLINGIDTCEGSTPSACQGALTLTSRIDVEVQG